MLYGAGTGTDSVCAVRVGESTATSGTAGSAAAAASGAAGAEGAEGAEEGAVAGVVGAAASGDDVRTQVVMTSVSSLHAVLSLQVSGWPGLTSAVHPVFPSLLPPSTIHVSLSLPPVFASSIARRPRTRSARCSRG
eukprot:2617174-Rhodomonas_salina.4